METLGPTELLIILAIILLVFGSARLPKLARSLGEAAHEFRRGTRDHGDTTDGTTRVAGSDETAALEEPGTENR